MTAPIPAPGSAFRPVFRGPVADVEKTHTERLLALAYVRPCFVCSKEGPCKHREPDVELILLGWKGSAQR